MVFKAHKPLAVNFSKQEDAGVKLKASDTKPNLVEKFTSETKDERHEICCYRINHARLVNRKNQLH